MRNLVRDAMLRQMGTTGSEDEYGPLPLDNPESPADTNQGPTEQPSGVVAPGSVSVAPVEPATPPETPPATVPADTNTGASSYSLSIAPSAAPADPGFSAAVRGQILNFMGQDPNAASINDADLKPIADAHRLAAQRGQEQTRARLAEHYGAQGYGGSGAMDSMIASALENEGQSNAAFEAQLVNQKLQERRQQIMDSLKMGVGLLSEDQRNALQMALSQIDAALRNRQMDLQNQQFNDNLGFQIGQWDSMLNQNLMNQLLG